LPDHVHLELLAQILNRRTFQRPATDDPSVVHQPGQRLAADLGRRGRNLFWNGDIKAEGR
jgi:hypothetical protein